MHVSVDHWEKLCELYPQTYERLKDIAFLKREIILHYMDKCV